MRLVTTEKLVELQKHPKNIRNICIMAHVDHGKTTLADSLVASNGIISQRLVGRLRYMDSRQDEQERGITMKSSSISLHYTVSEEEYLINLIDSPGHVDFSSEVSTAVRLCDGAMIVVDVVEGVCAQTIVALRQAWQENIKLVLVLNKIDRLITEVKLEPLDAYLLLTQVLEKVNVVMAELITSEVFGQENIESDPSRVRKDSASQPEYYDWTSALDDVDDSNAYFAPDQGNVIFASAYDGWGFKVEDFAKIYSKKMGVKEAVLNKTLWGDFYLNMKQKRIYKGAQEKAKKPLFVQLVLENIWSLYDAIAIRKDKIRIDKMVQNLELTIPPRILNQTDIKAVLQSVMGTWLPLSRAILEMVCRKLPSPLDLEERRAERLMFSKAKSFAVLPAESQALKSAFVHCDSSEEAPVIVFVSKMFAIDRSSLPENRPKPLTAEEIAARRELARARLAEKAAKQTQSIIESVTTESSTSTAKEPEVQAVELPQDAFVAFCRVYSGTIKSGCELYVLGPRHDPSDLQNIKIASSLKDLEAGQHVTKAKIDHLYILMGRELEAIESAPAGNIIGIGGLEDHILKTATVSSTLVCPPFVDLNLMAVPILRVALEPAHTGDLHKLVQGLKLLNQADPSVQIFVQETGEHVLVTAGEVHLQRCLDDLRERFAKIAITASPPIVPFRETVVTPPKVDMVNELIESQQKPSLNQPTVTGKINTAENGNGDGIILQSTANKKCWFKIQARPLPPEVTKLLEEGQDLLRNMNEMHKISTSEERDLFVASAAFHNLSAFKNNLQKAFEAAGWNADTVNQIWSFGPKKCGPNVLINNVKGYRAGFVWPIEMTGNAEANSNTSESTAKVQSYDSYFVNGFQLATVAGPLCDEPMMGVGFVVHDWTLSDSPTATEANESAAPMTFSNDPYGPFSGQVISAVKDACRKAFQAQPQRLMVAMYSCSVQVNSEALGKLYAVLGKRGGRILHGDLQEGSTVFEVTALLPVVESFDFANEVRRQTSGLALPQMVFSGWEGITVKLTQEMAKKRVDLMGRGRGIAERNVCRLELRVGRMKEAMMLLNEWKKVQEFMNEVTRRIVGIQHEILQVLEIDPFWQPTTEEEYLHFGEKADTENRARKYMNGVRKRKGLRVEEKTVEHAEKQRTLTRNK